MILADDDYRYFPECLDDAAHREGLAINAYLFMTSDVHLLLTSAEEGSARLVLKSVGRCYGRYSNQRHRRAGMQ